MFKVFLVEDEVMTREGIRDSIAWSDTGYEFCGEAPDGEIALPLIRRQQPDVVITDIQMPFMDGLELSRVLHETMPNIKIIILSGHDEFKYAQKAIQLGVTEYLLKPLSSQELRAALRKVGQQIDQERQVSTQLAALQARAPERPGDDLNAQVLQQLLRSGVKAEIPHTLDTYLHPLGEMPNASAGQIAHLLNTTLDQIAATLRELDLPAELVRPESPNSASAEPLRTKLQRVLERVIDYRDRQTDHQQALIDQACAYIETHYANPEISLNMVAASIMLSPSYFSMVFGRKVGETFTEFLTRVRIRRAMELLRTTALTSGEIALRVGYQNPRYFHAVFRKATGQSPIEFRRQV